MQITNVRREISSSEGFAEKTRICCCYCKACKVIQIRGYNSSAFKKRRQEDFFEAYIDGEEFFQLVDAIRCTVSFFSIAFYRIESTIEVHIYLLTSVLNDPSVSSSHLMWINKIIAHFFPQQVQTIDAKHILKPRKKEDCKGFLRLLSHLRPACKEWKLRTSSIVPILRPYQVDAVRFMISREMEPQLDYSSKNFFVQVPTNPPFYFAVYTSAFFNSIPDPFKVPPGGILADEMGLGKTVELLGLIMSHQRGETPSIDRNPIAMRAVVDTILEEVVSTVVAGLDGCLPLSCTRKKRSWHLYFNELEDEPKKKRKRTIGPLASITCLTCGVLCSQAKVFWDRFDSSAVPFNCPNCIQKQENKKPIKATLVIAPQTICHQWYEEVKRHVRDDVKVDMYNGVAVEGYKHPEYLCTRDIVICSYETLAAEVHFIETNEKLASLRRPKYLIAPTPLLAVEWWRICIDEAQVIESGASVVSEMCWRLKAVNRWCITGTPITDTVENLYGLLSFIGVEPYCYRNWWHGALWLPYENGCCDPLVDLFSKIFWRNTKDDVIDQIAPPARGSEVTVLHFSPLEEQLYRETLANRLHRPSAVTSASYFDDMPIYELHGKVFDTIMEPLQQIRAFIVQPGLRFAKAKQRITSEEAMLEELFRITTLQIEESQRSILLYYNSLAGLDWLTGDLNGAARHYEKTLAALKLLEGTNEKLTLTEKRGPFRKLRSDGLQVVHAMNSLIDLMEEGVEVNNIDMETAHAKLKEAEDGYTEQAVTNLHAAYEALNELKPQYGRIKEYMDQSIGWITEAMTTVERLSLSHLFFDVIRGALDNNGRNDFPVHRMLDVSLICVQRWDEVVACVRKTVELMKGILAIKILDSSSKGLEAIIGCHYKQSEAPKKNCDLCMFNKQLNLFESLMFFGAPPKKKQSDDDEETVEGTAGAKKASSLEIVLRAVRALMLRSIEHFDRRLVDAAKETESLIDIFKTILQTGKDLYGACEDFAARTDELRQCKLRLKYASKAIIDQYGGIKDLPKDYIIDGSVSDLRQTQSQAVEAENLTQTRLIAKLRYISSLRSTQLTDCPICLNRLEDNWLVFPCAHCLCTACFAVFSRFTVSVSSIMKCPVCRSSTTRGSITFVQSRGPSRALHFLDSPSVVVKGNASVKLDAIIRRLLSIHLHDPRAKTLVFTSLTSVIPTICGLLEENNIPYRNFSTGRRQMTLAEFRLNPKIQIVEHRFEKHSTSLTSVIPTICGLLEENNIPYRNFSTGRRQMTLAEFRLNPKIQVLVMPINQGARGLNLTVANNIIFVEPQLDASQLAQAVGRIDRIGQTRRMMVHHFVVYGSIEEHIHHRITDPQNTEWTFGALKSLLYTGVEYLDQALNNEATQMDTNVATTSS
ncbi:E3 ubiquitin-protein ligase SHPRH [Toxocara canis]|uniref:E3 ubiquitin-protein ligase SHPRH n=1 Tax=Toxocara canis TaxID=6265 RepID=A0A0B2VS03_TOXCA|nr:E3 ubiquitin-protein ligase SHPRH [Toxocara canis]